MGQWRKEWQGYKKQYPAFEQSKDFKADIGPMLDVCEKDVAGIEKLMQKLRADMLELKKKGDLLNGSFTMYRTVVTELQQSDNSISSDFAQVEKLLRETHGDVLTRIKKKVAR